MTDRDEWGCSDTSEAMENVTFSLPPEAAKRLTDAAKGRKLSRSELIRRALRDYLNKPDE